MPKYRFTTDDGEDQTVGDTRLDLPNNKAAADEAQNALADIAQDKLPDGSEIEFRVAVENEDDEVVYQASLKFPGETAEQMAEHRQARRNGKNQNGGPSRDKD